ncbi:hypothetical protein [uncultured Methanobrevibacter sp.]|uniref:hypothetical protein n=1 Tax=uncultured Methanobrevibacter sp. TaxID=253161 RepID=UPI0025EF3431|nr:hypothetical protein [uncultured Methanobrevibacter sp.]
MSISEDLEDFNFTAFIIGTAIFVITPIIASHTEIDSFAAIGPFYIGYKSKNYMQGFAVGGLSSVFLWIAIIYGALGEMINLNLDPIYTNVLLFILFFIMGGFIALIGRYFKSNRDSAIQMANANKKGSKNVQKKVKPIEPGYKKAKDKLKK